MKLAKIYVDGAVKNNGGPGRIGAGVVLFLYNADNHGELYRDRFGFTRDVPLATNNLAELIAVMFGINCLYPPPKLTHLEVYTDSLWTVNALRGVWKVTHHLDLIRDILTLTGKYESFQIFWNKGHTGHRWNEMANNIAQMEAGTWRGKGNPYDDPLY